MKPRVEVGQVREESCPGKASLERITVRAQSVVDGKWRVVDGTGRTKWLKESSILKRFPVVVTDAPRPTQAGEARAFAEHEAGWQRVMTDAVATSAGCAKCGGIQQHTPTCPIGRAQEDVRGHAPSPLEVVRSKAVELACMSATTEARMALDALTAALAEVEAALRPFATFAEAHDESDKHFASPDFDLTKHAGERVTLGDCRRARDVLGR